MYKVEPFTALSCESVKSGLEAFSRFRKAFGACRTRGENFLPGTNRAHSPKTYKPQAWVYTPSMYRTRPAHNVRLVRLNTYASTPHPNL